MKDIIIDDERRVLSSVDALKDELIALTQELVRIPSVSGEEAEAQSFLNTKLREFGFTVESHAKSPSRPNLIASLGAMSSGTDSSKVRNILFVGHVDNIPAGNREDWLYDPYSAQIAGGRIFGRGVADMKSGLAAMIISARAINDSGVMNGRVSIASVVDEEVESEYGMKYLAEHRLLSADSAIFGEPSFPDMIIALKGGIWLRLTTFGKSVGSGWPDQGVNAVSKMTRVLSELEKVDISEGTFEHPLLGRPTIALGTTIRGGNMIHSIPDRCEATIDIYTVPGQSTSEVKSKIQSAVDRLVGSDKDLSVKVETIFETSPYITGRDEKIYRDLQSSISSVLGREATPTGIPSVGDARFMEELGIPSIVAYGPGEKGKGHVVNESVSIDTLSNVTKIYALTALRFCR